MKGRRRDKRVEKVRAELEKRGWMYPEEIAELVLVTERTARRYAAEMAEESENVEWGRPRPDATVKKRLVLVRPDESLSAFSE